MENNVNAGQVDIADKLASLGPEFNTNPGFGLEGILKGQEMRAEAAAKIGATPETKVTVIEPTIDDKVFAEVISPLNTSIQAIKQETKNQYGQVLNAINELKAGQRNDGEDAETIDPATTEIKSMRNEMAQLRLNNAYDRARNNLSSFKTKHPDFDWTEQNIQELWQTRIGNNVNLDETTDWDGYFKMNHDAKRALAQDKVIEELKGKVVSLESRRNSVNDLASMPRSTNTISMARPTNDGDINEELYQRATGRMTKGRFMGFNRILQEETQKMQLAGRI